VDLQAGHVLPASRFKMMRLWKSNLVNQCAVCNLKLGANIRWSFKAIRLLTVYITMKLIIHTFTVIGAVAILLITQTLITYIYYDVTLNGSTITNQIQADFIEIQGQLLSVDGS